MNKPNLMESVQPCSGQYSFWSDLRLNAWLGVAAIVYVSGLFLLKRNPEWSPILRGTVALAPLIPGLWYLRSCLRFIRGLDELQRRIQLDAILFAALGTLVLGAIVATLSAHEVPLGRFSHGLEMPEAFVVMFCLWAIGYAMANCRYK
jgi:uncharacterized protein YacL